MNLVMKVLKYGWNILQVLIIIYVILITVFIFCENKYGFTQFGKYTFNNVTSIDVKNMDEVREGDLLIIRNSDDIKKGDLVYYYAAYKEKYIIVSNVVNEVTKDRDHYNYTLGRDKTFVVSDSKIVGKYTYVYHNIGSILSVLESRYGFIFLVLLPVMIVFIYQIYQFLLLLRYDKLTDLANGKDEEIL